MCVLTCEFLTVYVSFDVCFWVRKGRMGARQRCEGSTVNVACLSISESACDASVVPDVTLHFFRSGNDCP